MFFSEAVDLIRWYGGVLVMPAGVERWPRLRRPYGEEARQPWAILTSSARYSFIVLVEYVISSWFSRVPYRPLWNEIRLGSARSF